MGQGLAADGGEAGLESAMLLVAFTGQLLAGAAVVWAWRGFLRRSLTAVAAVAVLFGAWLAALTFV